MKRRKNDTVAASVAGQLLKQYAGHFTNGCLHTPSLPFLPSWVNDTWCIRQRDQITVLITSFRDDTADSTGRNMDETFYVEGSFGWIYIFSILLTAQVPSVLWCCWLGGRKGIRPVKKQWWGAGMVICLERGADLHIAQLMPLPLTVSCFNKIQIGFTFLVPAHLGSPGKRAVKWMCVCVC